VVQKFLITNDAQEYRACYNRHATFYLIMPALVAGIHVLVASRAKDVDGRDKPGHD
jgi:hypothetical protein